MRVIIDGSNVAADVIINTKVQMKVEMEEQNKELPLKVLKIDYNCGHGRRDPIAFGASGSYEKDYNSRIGDTIMAKLRENGAEVIDVRSGDTYVELAERCRIANEAKADIFISGHHNGHTNPAFNRIETYHFPGSVKGKALAEAIHKYVAPASGLVDRGVKEARFQVLRETIMPAVLIEFGFITNVDEETIIASDIFVQQTVAKVLNGMTEYYATQ